jgi:hypothetical protein
VSQASGWLTVTVTSKFPGLNAFFEKFNVALIMAAVVHNIGSVLVVIASASLAIFPDQIKAK